MPNPGSDSNTNPRVSDKDADPELKIQDPDRNQKSWVPDLAKDPDLHQLQAPDPDPKICVPALGPGSKTSSFRSYKSFWIHKTECVKIPFNDLKITKYRTGIHILKWV
jgi:hypothetical protein